MRRSSHAWLLVLAVLTAAGGAARGEGLKTPRVRVARAINSDNSVTGSVLVWVEPGVYPMQVSHQFDYKVDIIKSTAPAWLTTEEITNGAGQPVTRVKFISPMNSTSFPGEFFVCNFTDIRRPVDDLPPPRVVHVGLPLAIVFQFVIPAVFVFTGIYFQTAGVGGAWPAGIGSMLSGLTTLLLVLGCQYWGWKQTVGDGMSDTLVALGLGLLIFVDFLQLGVFRAAVEKVVGPPDSLTSEEIRRLVQYVGDMFPDTPFDRGATLETCGLEAIVSKIDKTGPATDFARRVVARVRKLRPSPPDNRPPMTLLIRHLADDYPGALNDADRQFLKSVLDKYESPPR